MENKTMAHKISGDFCTNGYYDGGRGAYFVELRAGRIFCAENRYGDDNGELFVRQYGNDAPILTNGVWEFWPDDVDLKRLGIVPTQMITA
jgi:hypothetical protein